MPLRLKGIEEKQRGLLVRMFFRILRWRQGHVPAPLQVYAWRPAILWHFLGLGRAIRRRGRLSPRLKGLAMYWTARNVECRF